MIRFAPAKTDEVKYLLPVMALIALGLLAANFLIMLI